MRKVIGNRVLGVLFVGLLALGIWLVYAVFAQKFTSFDKLSLTTDAIGLQLPERADVKIRGVLIGEVLDTTTNGNGGATITLGIDPSQLKTIPANVQASIIPKTLFGEKYVELDPPKGAPTAPPIEPGAHIGQSRPPIEVEKVLGDLYPLLRTIQPAELSYTLNAIADALQGRGEEVGQSLVTLNAYLKRLNPEVPQFVADIKLLGQDSNLYADVLPQVAQTLRNTVKTGNTLLDKQAALHQFLRDVRGLSDTTRGFLNANGDNLIELGKVSRPQLQLLKTYSPEYPCLLKGLVNQLPMLADTFRGFIFHISVQLIPGQPRGYNTGDKAVYGAKNAPNCAGLPNPPGNAEHPYGTPGYGHIPNFRDGVDDNGGSLGRGGYDNQRPATGFANSASPTAVGTPAQRRMIAALTAPALGVPVDQVAGITSLLFAPVAAGTEVSAR
ncbi:MCE family protein [Nocardioides terrisoli]|uniref:MCE family protein n=1 Tax=Nocardioides terrisoli TaxID=3388267 RepID=UPI00287BA3E3|nr:MCE family protein [Nocardioides marmorisolisilvae]